MTDRKDTKGLLPIALFCTVMSLTLLSLLLLATTFDSEILRYAVIVIGVGFLLTLFAFIWMRVRSGR